MKNFSSRLSFKRALLAFLPVYCRFWLTDAVYLNTSSFGNASPGIIYHGNAALIYFGAVEFTSKYARVGRITFADAQKVPIWYANSGRFSEFRSHFSFTIDPGGSSYYEDGFVYFLAPFGFNVPKDPAGPRPGIFYLRDSSQNLIVLVEFDSSVGYNWDPHPPYRHVGISCNSICSVVTVAWNASLHCGDLAVAFIKCNGMTKTNLNFQIDFAEFLPDWVMLGVSAATVDLIESHLLCPSEFISHLDISKGESTRAIKIFLPLKASVALLLALVIVAFDISRGKKIKERAREVALILLWCNFFITDAVYFNTTTFGRKTPLIDYHGDAVPNSFGAVELTNSDIFNSVGWVTFAGEVPLWDSKSSKLADFTTRFSFTIDTLNRPYTGDGFVFFLAPVGFNIPPNSHGGFLGIFNSTTSNSTHNQIVFVEFDSYVNDLKDPPYRHVGINYNSIRSAVTTPWNTTLHSGDTADVQINYNITTKTMEVSWAYRLTQNLSEITNLDLQIDLAEFLTESVMVGFSAATGLNIESHLIHSWEFTSNLDIKNGDRSKAIKIFVPLAASCALLMALAFVAFAVLHRKKRKERETEVMNLLSIDADFEKEAGPKMFSRKVLEKATDNFCDKRKLGEGGFGSVYRGCLNDTKKQIAVKKISQRSKQGKNEYMTEVKIISRLRHRNLVQLIGWCHEKGEFLLIYEFMSNGSLNSHLFDVNKNLAWSVRYRIACEIASGLLYLHEEGEQCVIHRDIKSSNIMLDSNFTVKVGDFGLARLIDHDQDAKATAVAGTPGYMAPEYIRTGRLTKESDVFSFGLVALEIATGRRAVGMDGNFCIAGLIEWVWGIYGNEKLLSAVDEKLKNEYIEKEAECLMIVGLWCAHPDHRLRASIRQAIQVLHFEAELPSLPSIMPDPMYQALKVPTPEVISGDPSLTCTNMNQGR